MNDLIEDINYYLFTFLHDEISLVILSYVNKKYELLCSRYCQRNQLFRIISCSNIVDNGYLNLLKWAYQIGYQLDFDICYNAAQKGHLEILKWARQNGC